MYGKKKWTAEMWRNSDSDYEKNVLTNWEKDRDREAETKREKNIDRLKE